MSRLASPLHGDDSTELLTARESMDAYSATSRTAAREQVAMSPTQKLSEGTILSRGGPAFVVKYMSSKGLKKRMLADFFTYHGIQRVFIAISLIGLLSMATSAGLNAGTYSTCELQVPHGDRCCRCICDGHGDLCVAVDNVTLGYRLVPQPPLPPRSKERFVVLYNNAVSNGCVLLGIAISVIQLLIAFHSENFYQIVCAWAVAATVNLAFSYVTIDGQGLNPSLQTSAIALLWVGVVCGVLSLFMLKPLDSTFGIVRFEQGAFGNQKRQALRRYQSWFAMTVLDLQIAICFYAVIILSGSAPHLGAVTMWVFSDIVSGPLMLFFARREKKLQVSLLCFLRFFMMVAWGADLQNVVLCFEDYRSSAANILQLYTDQTTYLFPEPHSAADEVQAVCPSFIGLRMNDTVTTTQVSMGVLAGAVRLNSTRLTISFVREAFKQPNEVLDMFFELPKTAPPKVRLVDELSQA